MSIASKIGTVIGTGTAYVVHYLGKSSTPLGVVGIIYTHREKIQEFAVNHAIDRNSPDALQDNIFECLQYLE